MPTIKEILRQEQSPLRAAARNGIPGDPAPCQRLPSLKAKAVSIAASVRDGTATAGAIKSFLQEEILEFSGNEFSGNEFSGEKPAPEMTADVLKAASAFAIIKAMAGLMDDAPSNFTG